MNQTNQIDNLGKNGKYANELLQSKMTANFITIPQTTLNYEELHKILIQEKFTKYLISKLEKHSNGGLHIHLLIQTDQIRLKRLHNIIISLDGRIDGYIKYEKPRNFKASINYLEKEETAVEPPLIYGTYKGPGGNNRKPHDYTDIQQYAEEGNTQEALELLKEHDYIKYLQYKEQFTEALKTENTTRKKYDLPDFTNITLKPKQKEVYDLLQQQPKARRIIWVSGQYGSGKSLLYNYIKENHEYGMYDAGQSSSLDNVAYGYDEEGVIAWDLPRTFNFQDFGDQLANVIEKFSDFGQSITSKKYKGKSQKVRGHTIVFSNQYPIDQLKHRDIIHIDLSDKTDQAIEHDGGFHQVQISQEELYNTQYEHKTPFIQTDEETEEEEHPDDWENNYLVVKDTDHINIKYVMKTPIKAQFVKILNKTDYDCLFIKELDSINEAIQYNPDPIEYKEIQTEEELFKLSKNGYSLIK